MLPVPGRGQQRESVVREAGWAGPRDGFYEAVISVHEIASWVSVFTEIGLWEVVHDKAASPELVAWYREHSGGPLASPDLPAREVLLANPGTETGHLRLIDFGVDDAQLMRPSQQPWDTGGVFDLNMRVRRVDESLQALRKRGWDGVSEPVEFTFGPFTVREVIVRGPDGVLFALIERVAPELEDWPHLKSFSRLFNSTQVVADFEASLDFYRDKLGFREYLEHYGPSKEPGANVLGLPHNLTTEIPRKVVILSPDGRNNGSVELLAFEGAVGADRSQSSVAPARGILALRFAVADAAGYREFLENQGVTVGALVSLPALWPLGGASSVQSKAFAVVSPEGARLEFFENPRP